jgi:hypothetical protein
LPQSPPLGSGKLPAAKLRTFPARSILCRSKLCFRLPGSDVKTLLNPSDKKIDRPPFANDLAHDPPQMRQDVRSPNGARPRRRLSHVRSDCSAGASRHVVVSVSAAGWEHARIAPGGTRFTPFDLSDFPWSHSLLIGQARAPSGRARMEGNIGIRLTKKKRPAPHAGTGAALGIECLLLVG